MRAERLKKPIRDPSVFIKTITVIARYFLFLWHVSVHTTAQSWQSAALELLSSPWSSEHLRYVQFGPSDSKLQCNWQLPSQLQSTSSPSQLSSHNLSMGFVVNKVTLRPVCFQLFYFDTASRGNFDSLVKSRT